MTDEGVPVKKSTTMVKALAFKKMRKAKGKGKKEARVTGKATEGGATVEAPKPKAKSGRARFAAAAGRIK